MDRTYALGMDERAIAERVVNWFAQRDYEMENATLVGFPCSVARTAEFRWIWLGTLQVFVFVAAVEQSLGVELAQIFTEASVEYAKVNSATRERSAYTGSIVLGAAYAGFLRELVNESVDAALGGRPA